MPIGSRKQTGFTYIGLLIAVAFFGLGSVGAARLLASTERAEREAELLFIGHQFRQAIRSYVQSGPRAGQYPVALEDLLQDSRYPTPRRHLRRLFVDPITGNVDWGLVTAPEGGIMGVYSLSDREPLKRASFDAEDADFAAALKPQKPLESAAKSTLQPIGQVLSTSQPRPLNSDTYTYRDWKFVYHPAVTGGARQPSGGGA
jgi:type II secretory pathway pseudopilin PulG